MIQDPKLTSRFENDALPKFERVDFDAAIRLERCGSTCDAYIARYRRRRVFVKRLKEEYRYNAVYRAAFEKEYELGAGLRHRSLPDYREIGDDYIIMDFIDGVTLADIINGAANEDDKYSAAINWLKKPKNIRKVLQELTEVAGYLHRHNVVHCDIKPDNVMLTDESYNVVLIDLDKAYTCWFDDTSGSPEIYGLDKAKRGSEAIDYRGIGSIVDMLGKAGFPTGRFRRFRKRCFSENIDYDSLLSSLSDNRLTWSVSIAGVVLALITVAVIIGKSGSPDQDKAQEMRYIPSVDVATYSGETETDTITVVKPISENKVMPQVASEKRHAEPENLDKELNRIFKELTDYVWELDRISLKEGISCDELMDSMRYYTDLEAAGLSQAYKITQKINKDEDFLESMKTVFHKKQYLDYARFEDSVQKVVGARYKLLVQNSDIKRLTPPIRK